VQNLKKLFYSALTCTFLLNINIPANSTEKEVKVYSGRHYNTDRNIYKKFAEETGIKVRLIEAAGISLIERMKREGKNSQADLILLVDAARITNAAKAGLLQSIESSKKENPENTKLTISLSPTLLSLLNNKQIQETFPSWIKTRNDFLNELPLEEKNASAFLMKNLNDKYLYWQNCSGNLIEKFRLLNNSGNLDILTCAATHGYLPILRENPETVKGQINTAIRSHENIFKTKPLGIWLPECAYYEGLDELLFNSGIRYTILDGHGILNSTPRPRYGVYAPICSKKGVAFFGRDSESTLPVWSAKDGFPGDKVYREFHKDLGWELPLSKLQKKGISTKRPLGLKFHKITDENISLGKKEFYLENEAKNKAA